MVVLSQPAAELVNWQIAPQTYICPCGMNNTVVMRVGSGDVCDVCGLDWEDWEVRREAAREKRRRREAAEARGGGGGRA